LPAVAAAELVYHHLILDKVVVEEQEVLELVVDCL
jgi:hypothetical protein